MSARNNLEVIMSHKRWQRWNTDTFVENMKEKYGEKYDYSKIIYVNSKTRITIICNKCGNQWDILPLNNHFGCRNCQYKMLPQNKPLDHDKFVEQARSIHGDKYEYISSYISNKKKIKIKCNKCQNIFEQRASSHLDGCGCRICKYQNLKQNRPMEYNLFVTRCKAIHNEKYDYCDDYNGLKNKIKIYCRKHEEHFYQNAGAHLLKGQGCPKCMYSKGEESIAKFLCKQKIDFIPQKRFDECKDKIALSFDFYLPNYNTCIEYDGELHYYAVSHFGGEKALKKTQQHDNIKTVFCDKNKINLIRIPFFNNKDISSILSKALNVSQTESLN
jgi:DNA-directed RNA polymerase subunit RPC12/RpoP